MNVVRIYVASSWRNAYQPNVVKLLSDAGHEVYDFRNPSDGDTGFAWSQIDPEWENWSPAQFRNALEHPLAEAGFTSDMRALTRCDLCLLVLPCGRSAHLELGFARGAGKRTAIYLPEQSEPELMYRMVDRLLVLGELEQWVQGLNDD